MKITHLTDALISGVGSFQNVTTDINIDVMFMFVLDTEGLGASQLMQGWTQETKTAILHGKSSHRPFSLNDFFNNTQRLIDSSLT